MISNNDTSIPTVHSFHTSEMYMQSHVYLYINVLKFLFSVQKIIVFCVCDKIPLILKKKSRCNWNCQMVFNNLFTQNGFIYIYMQMRKESAHFCTVFLVIGTFFFYHKRLAAYWRIFHSYGDGLWKGKEKHHKHDTDTFVTVLVRIRNKTYTILHLFYIHPYSLRQNIKYVEEIR